MIDTIKIFQNYIPESYHIKLNENEESKDLLVYNIYNEKKNYVGYLHLTSQGEIKKYEDTDDILKTEKHLINKSEIKEKATRLVKELYKDKVLSLVSLIKKLDNFVVLYEIKEPKYDLTLPGTGIELNYNLTGTLKKINQRIETYEIEYPETILSPEEAKSKFMDNLNLDLKISKPKNHLHYHLFYRINKKLLYIPASGEDGEYINNQRKLKSLEPFETSSKNLFRILGLNDDYKKVIKKSKRNYKIEIWSKYNKKELKKLNSGLHEFNKGIIKYKIDKHMHQIVEICDGEDLEEDFNEKIVEKHAYEKALDFLFTIYPKADELFDIIELVKDEGNIDKINKEPNYTYYFNRVHDSIEIENQIAYICVGQYTGMINKYCAPSVMEKELSHINVFAKVSESEAKSIYKEELHMKLNFVKKENEQIKYELVYVPTSPNKNGEINLIDAHLGTLYND